MNEKQMTHLQAVKKKKQRKKVLPYLFVLPTVLMYCSWCYFPFLKSIVLSLTVSNAKGEIKKWVGFQNFIRLFQDDKTWKILGNTFRFALMLGVGTLLVSMVLSLLSVEKVRGCRVYQTMYALPMAIASVAASVAFKQIYKAEGLLNAVLGSNTNWLLQENTAIWAVGLASIWCALGSSFLFLLVGFRNVPLDLLESSRVDGANGLQRIWKIMLPCASPQIFFVVFLNINSSFKSFAMIRQLTGGGPNNSTMVLPYEIYTQALQHGRFETACAEAMMLCLIIVIFQRIQFRLEHKLVVY